MRSRIFAGLLIALLLSGQTWQPALPGYRYEFPRDHFNHPAYQTEWWYYTGNLRAADGRRFGFELTFFRQAVRLPEEAASSPTWRPRQIYLAHLALSDIDGQHFYHTERLNRAGPGLAGIDAAAERYWNGNWQVQWKSLHSGEQQLSAVCENFSLQLLVSAQKPLVVHGKDGISQKGPLPGEASHYISFTRLAAKGHLQLNGKSQPLAGLAWMDHEFFTEQPDKELAGWDWFAIQLENHEELMLYRLRSISGEASRFSSGTYIDAQGKSHFLAASDFSLSPSDLWQSPHSNARYPLTWRISVPSLGLELVERSALRDQELFKQGSLTPTYWEGAVSYRGRMHEKEVSGVGYLEMTGYQPDFHK